MTTSYPASVEIGRVGRREASRPVASLGRIDGEGAKAVLVRRSGSMIREVTRASNGMLAA
jgi:hypothetical protein